MSKTINKSISFLLFAALILVTLSPIAQIVSANNAQYENHKTDVIITKVDTEADAKEMTIKELEEGIGDLGAWFGTSAAPLKGISFTYYKVDNLDGLSMSEHNTPEKMAAAGYGEGTEVGPTDDNGKVTLEGLENGLYWVVENPNSLVTSSKAVPFALELPFTNSKGDGYLDRIHVYPKNTVTKEEPEIDKEVNKEINEIGDVHTWTVGIAVPEGVGSYEQLGFIDEIDSRLDWIGPETITVKIPGGDALIKDEHYTVEYVDGGTGKYEPQLGDDITGTLTIDFTAEGLKFLEEKGAVRVETTFETKINNTAEVNEDIPNRPGLTFDNGIGNFAKPGDPTNPPKTPEDPDPVVKTLGVKVIKVDSIDETPLEGAEFILQNKNDEYAIFEIIDEIYVLEGWTSNEAAATTLITNHSGQFNIKGLEENDYTLVETKAPEGYALPSGEYRETIVSVDVNTHQFEHAKEIENTKMTIPQTGGIGTVIFTIIGGIIMIFSVIFYRRTQTN